MFAGCRAGSICCMRVDDGRVVDVAHDGQARAEAGRFGRGVPGPQQARHFDRAQQDREEQCCDDRELDRGRAPLPAAATCASVVHRCDLMVMLMSLKFSVAGAT